MRGTCMEMCPARERVLREQQGRLHPFEILKHGNSQRKPRADIAATVKEFCRPAAGKQLTADELRPATVLIKTIDYLLRDVLTKSNPWYFKCDFVSDRIRAIRQDLTAQQITGQHAVGILERATRYYLVTAVKLCQEPLKRYDPALHHTHTQECLKKLLSLYNSNNPQAVAYPIWASFEACYLLLNLGSPQACYKILQLPNALKKQSTLQLAIDFTKVYLNGNFVQIFRILKQLPYLESCAVFRHIQPIRCQALKVMNSAYSSKNLHYPLSLLTRVLHFDDEDETAHFCLLHGVNVSGGKVFFSKGQFVETENHRPLRCHELIESKLKCDLPHVLLFHEQCGKNEVGDSVEKLLEPQGKDKKNREAPEATTEVQNMAGVQKEGAGSGLNELKGYRGRGRAKRNSNMT